MNLHSFEVQAILQRCQLQEYSVIYHSKVSTALLLCVQALGECAQEYQQYYVPELQAKQQRKEALEQKRREKEMAKLRADMADKASLQEGAAEGASSSAAAAAAGPAALLQQLQQGLEEDEAEEASVDLNLSDDSIGSDSYEQQG
jgi:mevalonate pyrophosphate decarboxylase